MSPAFEKVQQVLKQLPGLGYRSAERIALHLLVEKPERKDELIAALAEAAKKLKCCPMTGNLCEGDVCEIYTDPNRTQAVVCVIEHVTDLWAMERAGVFRGTYHVLYGKLSPIHGVGPEQLNFEALEQRLASGDVKELILALGNDIEGEATCHYIQDTLIAGLDIKLSRIGFGLPSGSGVTYADSATLRSALEGRRDFHSS